LGGAWVAFVLRQYCWSLEGREGLMLLGGRRGIYSGNKDRGRKTDRRSRQWLYDKILILLGRKDPEKVEKLPKRQFRGDERGEREVEFAGAGWVGWGVFGRKSKGC